MPITNQNDEFSDAHHYLNGELSDTHHHYDGELSYRA
jgi:hypothetical protein